MADVCDDCGRPVTVCGPEADFTECNRLAAIRLADDAAKGLCRTCRAPETPRDTWCRPCVLARAEKAELELARLQSHGGYVKQREARKAAEARAGRAEATVERLLDVADVCAWAACAEDAGCWLGNWYASDDPDCYRPASALAALAHALRTAAKAGP